MRQAVNRGLFPILAFGALLALPFAAPAQAEPESIVRTATEQLLRDVKTRNQEFRENPEAFYRYVEDIVVPHFDWPYITRLILARNWKGASKEQRSRFADAFKGMLIRTYADALLEYHDAADVEWLPTQPGQSERDLLVRSQLNRDGSPPIPIGFAMLRRNEDWKIYDIVIESSSVVNSFRGQYNAEIRANGLQSLIERLESTQAKSAEEVIDAG